MKKKSQKLTNGVDCTGVWMNCDCTNGYCEASAGVKNGAVESEVTPSLHRRQLSFNRLPCSSINGVRKERYEGFFCLC